MAEKYQWIKKLTEKGEPKKGKTEYDQEKFEETKKSYKDRWKKLKDKILGK